MGKTMKLKGIYSVAALAVAVTAYGGGAPAQAQLPPRITVPSPPAPPPPPEPSLPKGTPIRIAFAPPSGVPIRYRATETKTVDGQARTQVTELVVRFERSGDSYLMEGRVEMPGLPSRLAAHPMIAAALRPVTFRLDQDGGLIGIENEDAYWAGLEPVIEQMVREEGKAPGAADLMRETFRKMREMPPADRARLIGRNFSAITANASIDLAIGETGETPVEEATVPMPAGNAKLRRTFAVTLASAGPTTARIETETRFDPEDLARFMSRLADLAPPGKRPAELPEMRQSFVSIVSRDSGLVLSSTETIRTAGSGATAPAARIITLQRVR